MRFAVQPPAQRRASPRARGVPRLLFHGQIPYEPCARAMPPQDNFLLSRRRKAVPGHTRTLTTGTDNPKEVKRRFLPTLKDGASTPRH